MRLTNWLRSWYHQRLTRKNCFHHNYYEDRSGALPESWIKEEKIDVGMRKIYWCTHCNKSWIP